MGMELQIQWQLVQLIATGFLWKHQGKITFQEDHSPFILGDLRSFKQELDLLVRN